ncbi:MAG: hypothetical protein QOJ03_3223 [Frankiaceae bacterium]|jgi:hypothetical protein|nr:hypothetical protein [Frankiaceae bacterium]
MKLRHILRPGLVVTAVAAAVVAVPAVAKTPPSNIGSASVYGLDRNFTLVGHTDLQQRGMNSPIAVAGKCVYVGDRYYSNSADEPTRPNGGIAVVDASVPTQPTQVGIIPPTGLSTQREIRADAGLGILVVEGYSPFINGYTPGSDAINYLKIYDIHSDCTKPKLLSTYDFGPRAPHEFFLWKDPAHPGRALAYVTFTIYSPDLMVIDLTDPASPALAGVYDLGIDQTQKTVDFADESGSGYLHSLAVSDDGTRAYMATWDWGYYELDTSMLANPPAAGVGVAHPVGIGHFDDGHNVHSAVPFAGKRPYVFFTQEEYGNAGHGCPFGWLRTAKLDSDGGATQVGEFKLPENDPQKCGEKNGTFSSHNPTLFPDVALMTYYSGGLRAVDLTDPAHPFEDGAYVPTPSFTPKLRDARLFFPPKDTPGLLPTDTTKPGSSAPPWTGAMWSYPVVQNGLIYVVDIDLGLYILSYTGPHAKEVSQAKFVEGNSSPSRYSSRDKMVTRPALQWERIAAEVEAGPATVHSPYRLADRRAMRHSGFFCM